jgi:micrococcal nuclease
MNNLLLVLVIGGSLMVARPHTVAVRPAERPTLTVQAVTRVYDGDTFFVDIEGCNIDLLCRDVPVRVRGIDAPELKGKCSQEKAQAIAARDRLRQLVSSPNQIILVNPERDKYFRILADVTSSGVDVATAMLTGKEVTPYDGKVRRPWC